RRRAGPDVGDAEPHRSLEARHRHRRGLHRHRVRHRAGEPVPAAHGQQAEDRRAGVVPRARNGDRGDDRHRTGREPAHHRHAPAELPALTMARRRRHHEEGENHERWAIPYGDLVTLLLAFFVVMYSISQVNEGKYRILSDSLNAAFRGEPTTFEPVQVGHQAATTVAAPLVQLPPDLRTMAMRQIAAELAEAMHPLIIQGLVDVEYGNGKVTIAIRS